MTGPVQIAWATSTPASTEAVNRLHDLGNGVIVVHPTPGSGGEGIARDVLHALGKQFRERTPRDPRRLQTLARIWLSAELARELVIAGADRRPASDWKLLRDLAGDADARLTLVVERRPTGDQVSALGDEIRELTLAELIEQLPPAMPPDTWGIFDESGSPNERLGYPPVPDVDFVFFPSACVDLLPEHDAARVLRAFECARAATMLWLAFRRGTEHRHVEPAACARVPGHARGAVRHRRWCDHRVARRAGRVPARRDPARDRPRHVRGRSPTPCRCARDHRDRGRLALLPRAAPRRHRRARGRNQSERRPDRRADARLGRPR